MAVLLALVPLGLWSWLYTARRDSAKFVFSIVFLGIVALVAVILVQIDGMPTWSRSVSDVYNSSKLGTIGLAGAAVAGALVWIWALTDTASKSVDWYFDYD